MKNQCRNVEPDRWIDEKEASAITGVSLAWFQHTVLIKREAGRVLKRLGRTERTRIAEKIVRLGENPDDPTLDVKKLQDAPFYRLRVGGWRVIFDRQDAVRIIAIEKIKPRGDAYK